MKIFALPLALAGVFGVSLFLVASSDTFHDCIERAQYKAAQTAPYKNPSSVPVSFGMRQHCIGHFLEKNAEGIIALFTIILAASTIALWLSTKALWRTTDATLRHTKDTAERQFRAYVGPPIVGVKQSGDDVEFTYGQFGGEAVHSTGFYAGVRFEDGAVKIGPVYAIAPT